MQQKDYKYVKADLAISQYVDSFWYLKPSSHNAAVSIPNGTIDLIFTKSKEGAFWVALMGVETKSSKVPDTVSDTHFAISFRPMAMEYILNLSVANILDTGNILPPDFWPIKAADLDDFDAFCTLATRIIQKRLPREIDSRKQKLFDLIFDSQGEMSVKELSEKIFWSDRQINRYFNQQFGLSLKAYCNIIRFRASLKHISEGKQFPEQNFTDQNHFIKSVKKYAGVTPKALSKNEDNRFSYLTILQNQKPDNV